jgi:GMP synthase-like glutamine amidotransferase
MRAQNPLVWLPACHRRLDLADPGGYTVLADRYAAAVTALGLQPVLFPMAGAPVLGVCRGLQEMNVALGGSLHQQLHAEPGLMDHREPDAADLDVQFAIRHEVRLAPGSAFAQWAGGTTAMVNSLHGQGIKRLGEGLVPEALAPSSRC